MLKKLRQERDARAARECIRPLRKRIFNDAETLLQQSKVAYAPCELAVFAECTPLIVYEQSRPNGFDRNIVDLVAALSVEGLSHDLQTVSRLKLTSELTLIYGDDVRRLFEDRYMAYRETLIRDIEIFMESPTSLGSFGATSMMAADHIFADRQQRTEKNLLLATRMSTYVRGAMQAIQGL